MSSSSYSLTRTSEEGWMAIVEDIKKAKHSIDCELYIVDVDDAGLYLINALREKSREGVKVRLLVDAAGSYVLYLASTLKAEMRADGIELSFFNHFIPWYPKTINLWYFRNHRRSIVIDERIAYTGGLCFSKNMSGWRETMLRITVPEAIVEMEQAFSRMWKLSERKQFEMRIKPVEKDWFYLTNAPLPGRYYYYNMMKKLIKEAKKEIFLTTPYFVPDHLFFLTLLRAQKRGVTVHLLVPKESNHPFVGYAGDFYKERLLNHGARIYQYTKSMLHSKTAVFDDDAATVGSLNLDNVSLRYNFEGGLIIKDKGCIAELKRDFFDDIKDLDPITLDEWHKRPLKEKFMAYLTWPIRKLL